MKKITLLSMLLTLTLSFKAFSNPVTYPEGTFECKTEFSEFREISLFDREDFPRLGPIFEKPIKIKTKLFVHFNGEIGNATVLNPLNSFPNWMLFNKVNTKKANESAVLVLEESNSLYYVLEWDTWYFGSTVIIEPKTIESKKMEISISITDNDGISEELNNVLCTKL